MSQRRNILLLVAGALVLLLSLNFLSFRAARSTTEVRNSLSTFRAGERLPDNMGSGFTLAYTISGEDQLAEALETELQAALETQTSVGTARLVEGITANEGNPFLLVELTPDRLWTPFYGRATVTAQIYFADDGDVPWPLDEAVIMEASPAIKAAGEFMLADRTWGLISKPAYSEQLAEALAEAIAAALQRDVFTFPGA